MAFHGPYLESAGVSSDVLIEEYGELPVIDGLSLLQGLVIELCDFARLHRWTDKKLIDIILKITPDITKSYDTIQIRISRLRAKKRTVKKGATKYKAFVESPFFDSISPQNTDVVTPQETDILPEPHPVTTEAQKHIDTCTDSILSAVAAAQGRLADLNKEINLKKHLLNQHEKQLAKTKHDLEIASKKLPRLGHYSKQNVNKRDKRGREALRSIKVKEKIICQQTLELSDYCNKTRLMDKKIKTLLFKLLTEKKKKRNAQKNASWAKKKQLESHEGCVPKSKYLELKNKFCSSVSKIDVLKVELDGLKEQVKLKTMDLKDDKGRYGTETRMTVNELSSLDIAQSKVGPAMTLHIAKYFISQKNFSSKNWGISKDGTSRKKRKIQDTTLVADDGSTMSVGFCQVASETAQTISNVTSEHLDELAAVAGGDKNIFLHNILSKLSFFMSDRAAAEKKSNILLEEWRNSVLEDASEDDVQEINKFYCMAHVLLGCHRNVLGEIGPVINEKSALGRDQLPQFVNYRKDCIVERVVQTASDVFGPVGDHLGLRDLWEVHCATLDLKSLINNYKDNRFNGLFETSAQVLYHRKDFLYLLGMRSSNKKLQALSADLSDPLVVRFIQAMAVVFIQVTGPFWNLLEDGSVPYVSLCNFIQPLHAYLEAASEDPSIFFNEDSSACLRTHRGHSIQLYIQSGLLTAFYPEHEAELKQTPAAASRGLIKTVQMQLKDFLSRGCYGNLPSTQLLEYTTFSHKTNLACEHHFGSLDSSMKRRPNCTLHHHSTLHLLKRNHTAIKTWFTGLSDDKKKELWSRARANARSLRKIHQDAESEERQKLLPSSCQDKQADCNPQGQSQTTESKKLKGLRDKLDRLLPPQDTQLTPQQWVAVAYQEGWYPGLVLQHDA
ncbi:uncharacterized protein LOC143223841 [Tachypleus tridentatus]|uniref:uncharacterized protein LOC143223841 n=1 Tax=Tachypleus tridentatus TaxID=6853 RepID=UPI003FCF160D